MGSSTFPFWLDRPVGELIALECLGLEGSRPSAGDQDRFVLGMPLPAGNAAVAIHWVDFTDIGPASGLMGRDDGRSRPAEKIENNPAPAGDVLDCVRYHLDGFHSGMKGEFIHPVAFEGVYPLNAGRILDGWRGRRACDDVGKVRPQYL